MSTLVFRCTAEQQRRTGCHLQVACAAQPALLGDVRRTVVACLTCWQLDALIDATELIVSELLGNAARHGCQSSADTVTLFLRAVPGRRVLIGVHDPSPAAPALTMAGPESEGGRGLALVDAVSSNWGWTSAPDGGKYVWAEAAA
ncbi:ATP-binding protein [Streptomyces sp. SID8366]|uniref:ATP-binding protein n=1 Tax=unclassified Streptomyces TaxID=2593676 RepID=UPI000DB96C5B|nr:ATP-binding protein [Streptomyces sp. PsTaAH-130]MYU06016.1 ATP-binding protein [Streptomyces sp. SID8366]MYU67447.1 ATP-binding protein [Streptomyces sp. SID69]RAJ64078.1 histidine kinase-like protein [Streptomyces sp. PsTaAH-130]